MAKKTPHLLHTLLLYLLLALSSAHSAGISYTKIKSLYKDGEFEKIRVSLESFLKRNGKSAETKDKIFAYKYLGVIYAAEPEGYPVAETYFYQLLKVAPNAHLSDMYVSSAIEDLFSKTQLRFKKESQDNLAFDEFGTPRQPLEPEIPLAPIKQDSTRQIHPMKTDTIPTRRPSPQKESAIRIWPWVLGAGVVLAVGGYFWYSSLEKEKKHITNGGQI